MRDRNEEVETEMTNDVSRGPTEEQADRMAKYREMQRAIPGLDDMYRLVHALIASRGSHDSRILIVGAGGGRELEELSKSELALQMTAIDPSDQNLEGAKLVARKSGLSDRLVFFKESVDDLPGQQPFDIATSLLVMHHIDDDGSKSTYLTAIRDRLAAGGVLIHADVCFDSMEEFESLLPAYMAHARLAGIDHEISRIDPEAIPKLAIISPARTQTLFREAGFTPPREIFRSLWYRCWVSRKTEAPDKKHQHRTSRA